MHTDKPCCVVLHVRLHTRLDTQQTLHFMSYFRDSSNLLCYQTGNFDVRSQYLRRTLAYVLYAYIYIHNIFKNLGVQ